MAEARSEALPAGTTLKEVLPSLAGKRWFMAQLGDAEAISRGIDALGDAGGSDLLGSMTARDPRAIGVRGGYPQINVGLPSQHRTLLAFCRMAYERSAPARILVDKVAGDVWGEWVTWQTDDETLKEALEAVCKNPTGRPGDRPLWWWVERAYRIARRDARSLLYFVLEDASASSPWEAPRNVRGIRGLAVVRQDQIERPVVGDDPGDPETYGRVLAWRIRTAKDGSLGKAGSTVTVHADRVVPIVPYPDEDDEWDGKSVLAQNLNYVEMLENLLWANAEAYFQEASPFVIVSLDKDVKLTEPERQDAKATVANMQQSLTQRVFLRGVTVTVLQGSGQLANPLPHFEVAMKMFAMALGGIPTNILTGDQAGALASAKEDTRRYAGMNSKVQEQDADPVLRGILHRLLAWDVKSWGLPQAKAPADFTWNALYEADPKEEADRQESLMRTRTGYRRSNLPLPEDLDWDVTEWPEGTGPVPSSDPFGAFGRPQEAPAGRPAPADGGYGTQPDAGQGDAQPPAMDALGAVLRRFRARVVAALRPAFERAAQAARGDASASAGGLMVRRGDDEAGVQAAFADPRIRQALADAIEQGLLDGLVAGGNDAAERIGADHWYDLMRSPSAPRIRTLAGDLAASVQARLADEARQIVAAKLAAGTSPEGVARALMDRFDAVRVDADRIARTEAVRAFNRGAVESASLAGVRRMRFLAFRDADGGDPDGPCKALDGQTFDVDAVPQIPDDTHPNCRCALVPVVLPAVR